MRKVFFITVAAMTLYSCAKEEKVNEAIVAQTQEEIIEQHLKNGAWKYHYYSKEWQDEIDEGILKDSTIAYLWQQKAMPLFKQGKYELGMKYIDKAVIYDSQHWQDYRAFIKCIFAKTYNDAILDFMDYKSKFGNGYIMDHSYDFYIALSYLQLNMFEKAENVLEKTIEDQLSKSGEEWVHYLDLFYYGISKIEQKKLVESIAVFDRVLKKYPEFSDAQYYKAKTLFELGEIENAKELMKLANQNAKDGYSINEDNAIYERFPYQVRWKK